MEQLSDKEKYFDVAVIGGGPSGMMASGKAGEAGAKVLLIEKNKTPGKKLLLTGKGRCNFTRAEFNERLFVEDFGKGGKFLLSALFNFGAEDVIGFFEKHKLKTKIERGKRVFPATDQAEDVLNVLIRYLEENKVQVMGGTRVVDLEREGNRIKRLVTSKGDILAKNFIICTGGKSYPLTGSAGDGYDFARKLGHKIITPEPALVPIKIKEKWAGDLQGLSLKNVQINVFQNGKKQDDRFGEMLFAHFGLSGPIILDISKKVGELLKLGETIISLDLKPALEYSLLD